MYLPIQFLASKCEYFSLARRTSGAPSRTWRDDELAEWKSLGFATCPCLARCLSIRRQLLYCIERPV